MADLDPRDHCDRATEQDEFRELLAFGLPFRVMMVCSKSGTGKSSLLKRLQFNCYHYDPLVPCSLVELDKLDGQLTLFDVTSKLVDGFTERDDTVRDLFTTFNRLMSARASKDFTTFGDGDSSGTFLARDFRGQASGYATTVTGGEVNGMKVVADKAYITPAPAPAIQEFNAEQKRLVERRCVAGFFEDLRRICTQRPMAILLDGWQGCDRELRRTIFDRILSDNLLHRNSSMRPDKLALVVAGQTKGWGKGEHPNGLDPREFRDLFSSDADFAATVRPTELSREWEPAVVHEFMLKHGYKGPPELAREDVKAITARINTGFPLSKIIELVQRMSADAADMDYQPSLGGVAS